MDIKDLRPISLVHSSGKIVSKIMANQITPLIPSLVHPNQSAFIAGRSVVDNFLLVQQSIKTLHRRQVPAIMMKIYIEKAFDSVHWAFLLNLLQHRGFGPKWIARLAMLLSSASSRVLINGSPVQKFWHACGLRQGDLVSPLLFVIVMDTLTALFHKGEQSNLFQPLSRWGIKHRLSVYAYDAVLLIKPEVLEAESTVQLLEAFGHASGLSCNMAKSSISLIRCRQEDINNVAAILACAVKEFPVTYLGLPLSVTRLPKSALQPLIDRTADYLPTWKARYLRRAGRLILVNSTLTATSIYLMLVLDLPAWFISCIDKNMRGFFWCGHDEAKGGICLVNWKLVCTPKIYGGLGVHNLALLNQDLLLKWCWYEKVADEKPWNGLNLDLPIDAEGIFNAGLQCSLGNGSSFRYWTDRWINGRSLSQLVPALWKCVRPAAMRRTVVDAL
ncbi:hypothetical protein ACQJBY_032196 [Aegilops geniculata]